MVFPFAKPKRVPPLTMTFTTNSSGGNVLVTPPEVHQSLEILRLTAVLAELQLLLEGWDSGDVCLREWDQERPCPCARCRGLRIVRYGL